MEQDDVPIYQQVRDYNDFHTRFDRAAEISIIVKDINTLGQGKADTQFIKENMRMVLEMISPCESDIQFTTKMARLAALFEVELEQIKIEIEKPNFRRYNRIIKRWLNYRNIAYDPDMLTVWSNIKTLRNMEPIHSETDSLKLMQILDYFGQPKSLPIYYLNLWDEILDRFRLSLELFREILNKL